jgi:hypothetical protein
MSIYKKKQLGTEKRMRVGKMASGLTMGLKNLIDNEQAAY